MASAGADGRPAGADGRPAGADDLPAELLGRLFRLAHSLVELAEFGSREYGLGYARGRVLWELRSSGPMVMRKLSQALGVSPRTVTGLIDALEADGWVTRRPHQTDRRATVIEVTPAAAEACANLDDAYRGFAHLLIGDMAGRDLKRALAVIDQIEARLDAAVVEAETGLG